MQPSSGRNRKRLSWCPVGTLSALPLHAAGVYDGPSELRTSCADYVVSSYTPTLTSLLRAQKTAVPISRNSVDIALIAEKRPKESHLSVLHGVDAEVNNINMIAQTSHIRPLKVSQSSITVDRACDAIPAANILHLACHGIQDPRDITQSGFCLGDGRLTVSTLMQLDIKNPFLAFLGICETAKTDQPGQPDQVMHLAAAMMFLGFKSVVAPMWSV
jgi:CHAT domain-containing protein